MKTIAQWASLLPNGEGYLALSYLLNTTPGELRAQSETCAQSQTSAQSETGAQSVTSAKNGTSAKSRRIANSVPNSARNTSAIPIQKDKSKQQHPIEKGLSPEMLQRYQEIVRRRLAGEPLQYAIGEWEFYGHLFHVDPRALIPRPETELLVEMALREELGGKIIADIGTGTGAIALSIALEANPKPKKIYATDCSADALALAQKNANRLIMLSSVQPPQREGNDEQETSLTSCHTSDEKISFSSPSRRASDEASEFAENMIEWILGDGPSVLPEAVDVLLSNPPYIDPLEKEGLQEELRYEPSSALFAGEPGRGGLALYQAWIPLLKPLLRPHGVVLMEIGDRQGKDVANLFRQAGFCAVSVYLDYAGRDRFVRAER